MRATDIRSQDLANWRQDRHPRKAPTRRSSLNVVLRRRLRQPPFLAVDRRTETDSNAFPAQFGHHSFVFDFLIRCVKKTMNLLRSFVLLIDGMKKMNQMNRGVKSYLKLVLVRGTSQTVSRKLALKLTMLNYCFYTKNKELKKLFKKNTKNKSTTQK